eukprot:CAMPEP_0194536970 /NCGR_PEP_ID=MMETSP0253-20130528/76082_1 /TAXON_ID=2966 /ORGANISM="Noctiluca scintillans" /LENGTH=137 /DNA_ID=CAMNT_0039382945 /DNA_START=26 /DNA_END=439 /DNA_ORIENTATION=-
MSDEERKAQETSVLEALSAIGDTAPPTIFDKILKREIPASVVYEDELCLAFNDVNPQASTHILLIPKVRAGLSGISKATPEHAAILGHMMVQAGRIGKETCPSGYRLVVNDGPDGCQSVWHLHIHILGGRQMRWPPG